MWIFSNALNKNKVARTMSSSGFLLYIRLHAHIGYPSSSYSHYICIITSCELVRASQLHSCSAIYKQTATGKGEGKNIKVKYILIMPGHVKQQ